MNIVNIRTDLGAAIETVPGLKAVTKKAGTVVPPCVVLGPYNVAPNSAMGGLLSAVTFTLVVLVADAADGAVEDLDVYLSDEGDDSLIVALQDYDAASWDSLKVGQSDDIAIHQVGATEYLGCAMPVEIYA